MVTQCLCVNTLIERVWNGGKCSKNGTAGSFECRRLTTIGSSELLREIHPDLKILIPRQGQRVTNAPASCCRVWAAP
jgi:hypothetical protein